MKSRIFLKLLVGALLIIAVAMVALDIGVRQRWEQSLRAQLERTLQEKTKSLALRLEREDVRDFPRIAAQESNALKARVTVIARDGHVLADSEADPDRMENHSSRPEFVAALRGTSGESTRLSKTVGVEFLYTAQPTAFGAVRLAYPLSEVKASAAAVRQALWHSSLLALLLATVLAAAGSILMSRRLQRITHFAQRIASGDLSARVAESARDEISEIADALNTTAGKLESSFAALKNSERQLDTVISSMQEGVFAVDRNLRLIWSNAAFRRVAHVRLEAPLTDTVRDPEVLDAVTRAVADGVTATASAKGIAMGRSFVLKAAPMPNGGAVAVLHDVSEIERVEKTRRDFIANVSHELRTPLTAIQGFSETLLDSPPEELPSHREYLEIIHRNVVRMVRLTDDLLTLARVESGEQRLELEPISAAMLLSQAAATFREAARLAECELNVTQTTPTNVMADVSAIEQVIGNLISNALRYGKSGGKVELGAHDTDGKVEFFVRDFGPGISSEHLPHLFKRFYRVDKARSRETGGTGLGLAIVKHIIINHHGDVRAESAVGKGTTFFFTLIRQ